MGQYRQSARTYLVGHISVSRYPIAPNHHHVYHTLAHKRSRHIIAYQRSIDPELHQLVCRKSCALKQRTRFIGIDLRSQSQFLCPINGRKRRSVSGNRQMSGIAMRQYTASFRDKRYAMLPDFPAHGNIFIFNLNSFFTQNIFQTNEIFRLYFR